MKYAVLTATAEEEMPLLKELWLYFYDTYFNPSEAYEHLDMGTGSLLSLRLIILGLCIGLALAGFGAVFNKRVLGKTVRKILEMQCLSPNSALTLEELGFAGSVIAHFAVKRSTSVKRVVKCREEEEYNAKLEEKRLEYAKKRAENSSLPRFKETEYKIDPLTDHFYIPENLKYVAELKFDQKGSTWLSAIMFAVIMAVVFVVILVALPHILELLNDIAGSIDTSPDNIL